MWRAEVFFTNPCPSYINERHWRVVRRSMSPTPVTLGCWVGRRNMRLLVNREECFSILLRIAGADVAHTAFGMSWAQQWQIRVRLV
jgi:hypothetical protein